MELVLNYASPFIAYVQTWPFEITWSCTVSRYSSYIEFVTNDVIVKRRLNRSRNARMKDKLEPPIDFYDFRPTLFT